ncbi:hypothetical protein Ahy_B10g101407 [Arachis hypogaea]|uniref:Uncharacterized protein n=1 Tax=Arachis hypogaea TaxID=3818 RepID=A0A444WZH1_ARAHY|nr:hypothetical protein Ahy_B10g101407 [Arachis hypogaea]
MAVHGSGQQSLTHGGNQQPQACSHTTIFDFCPAITVRYFHCQTSSPPSLVIFSTILSPFLHGLQERSSLLLTPPLSAAALIVTPTNPAIALRLYTTIFHRLLREVVIAANIAFVGILHLKWFGVEGDYNIMAIDLFGPSLEDLFNYYNRKFTLKTVLMLADQLN